MHARSCTAVAASSQACSADQHLCVCIPPTGHQRKLRVTANPNITVAKEHVPKWCWKARTVLLGPLTLHDLDAGSFLQQTGADRQRT
jgi:hypothetical protein